MMYCLQDLLKNLPGILLRFRKEPVALTADIECMYHQVRIIPQDHTYKNIYASKFRESMYDFKGNQKESHSGNGFFGELVNAERKSQQLCFEKRMCAIGV